MNNYTRIKELILLLKDNLNNPKFYTNIWNKTKHCKENFYDVVYKEILHPYYELGFIWSDEEEALLRDLLHIGLEHLNDFSCNYMSMVCSARKLLITSLLRKLKIIKINNGGGQK